MRFSDSIYSKVNQESRNNLIQILNNENEILFQEGRKERSNTTVLCCMYKVQALISILVSSVW